MSKFEASSGRRRHRPRDGGICTGGEKSGDGRSVGYLLARPLSFYIPSAREVPASVGAGFAPLGLQGGFILMTYQFLRRGRDAVTLAGSKAGLCFVRWGFSVLRLGHSFSLLLLFLSFLPFTCCGRGCHARFCMSTSCIIKTRVGGQYSIVPRALDSARCAPLPTYNAACSIPVENSHHHAKSVGHHIPYSIHATLGNLVPKHPTLNTFPLPLSAAAARW